MDWESWLVGFVDGEGCFCVGISQPNKERLPHIRFYFDIANSNKAILERIRKYFGGGYILTKMHSKHPVYHYSVCDVETVDKVADFFDCHKLLVKNQDFEAWLKCLKLVRDYRKTKRYLHPDIVEQVDKLRPKRFHPNSEERYPRKLIFRHYCEVCGQLKLPGHQHTHKLSPTNRGGLPISLTSN